MGHFNSESLSPAPEEARPTGVRHTVVTLTTLTAVLLYLDRYCLSFMERYIKEDLRLSNDQASLLLSVFFWTYALAQVPSGWLSDRFGARRALALYVLLWSLFTGLMGVAESFFALLIYRLGCGLAQAGAYPTSAGLLSKWVPFSDRALASAVVSTGGRIGGFIAPVLTAYLMLAFGPTGADSPPGDANLEFYGQGWRPVMFVYGGAGVLVTALFWLRVRDRPQDHSSCNGAEIELIEQGRPSGAASPHGRVGGMPIGPMLRSRSLWLSSVSQFGTNFGWLFLTTWLPRYLAEVHGVPIQQRGWLVSLPIFLGMAGMMAGGWITDRLTRKLGLRWGRCLPLALTRFVAMAAFLACVLLDSPWPITAALSVVAIATDLGTAATWAFMQDVGGRHVGSVLGWGNMWGSFGAALSPLVLNWVIGPGRWDACFLTCAAAFFLSGVASLGIDATVPIVPADTGNP
jgi:ACS family glucarate transporter-like MFS transporter